MSESRIPDGDTDAFQVLSCCVSFLGVTVTAICLFHRLVTSDICSFQSLRKISVSKTLVLSLLLDSWIFVAVAGVLTQAVGFSSVGHCSTAIWLCILAYFVTKMMIYFLLLEKVYAVWPNRGSRMTSPLYRFGFLITLGFCIVLGLAIANRKAFHGQAGECMIGFRQNILYGVISFDVFINVVLTALFLIPLRGVVGQSVSLREVTKRNMIAAAISLASSLANVISLTALRGREHAWVCLTSCSVDAVVNALVAFWVTNNSNEANPYNPKVVPVGSPTRAHFHFHNTLVTNGDTTLVTMNDHGQLRPFSIAVTHNSTHSDEDPPPIPSTHAVTAHSNNAIPYPDPAQCSSNNKTCIPGHLELPRFSEPWVEYRPSSALHGDVLIGERSELYRHESGSRISSRFSLSSGFASIINNGH